MTGRLALALGLLVLAGLVGYVALEAESTPPLASVTGIVLKVEGQNAVAVNSFVLRSAAGAQLTFDVGRLELTNGGLPAEHLRDHLRSGAPIVVDYYRDGDRLVAVRYVDAPVPTQAPITSPTSPSPSATTAPPPGSVGFGAFVAGLSALTFVTSAGDGSGRLYALEQRGRIVLLDADGTLQDQPFLDITERVSSGGERGLLGLAFAPDYAASGRLYVDYTNLAGDTVVAEYRRSTDTSADPASERIVLHIAQPYANHNGGMLAFGPDGYLYIGTGDGGSGGDPQGNGQNHTSLLGKILRLDVSVSDPAPELWALGLRNPWRFSFDRATGDMWIGDVGQATWEEIDLAPAGQGGLNFGWNVMEGPDCYRASSCDTNGLVLPIAWHATHADGGCAITGGYVYRGAAVSGLAGTYLFSDYCAGLVWGFDAATAVRDGQADYRQLASTGLHVSSFGQDEAGELYLATAEGTILRLVSAD